MKGLVFVVLLLSACTSKAPPMEGKCSAVDVDHYEASVPVGPTVRCLWRSRSWDCTDHWALLGDYWSCDATGPAAAETVRP